MVDVRIAQRMDYPAIYVEIDRIKSMHLGLTTENVIKNLVTATNSSVNFAPAFWIDHRNGNHYFIGAQYREEDLESLEDLRNIPITGEKSHGVVPLRNIAELSRTMGPAVINHLNITRVIDVYADVEGGQYLGDVVAVLEARLATSQALAPQPGESVRGLHYEVQGPEYAGRGYTYTLTGEVATMRESMEQLSRGLLLAIFLVYLVMVAQLQSFLDPVIVLCAVPLGLVGVVGMLTLTGTPLNIQSGMGIILMVGVVVQFSILLVDFANRRVKSGLSVRDAIREAGAIRLRPILMTWLAAVLALLPMAIGFEGGEGNIPLARAIIGAILGGAGLTLLIVPAIYVKLKRPSTLAV
ncbi:MAG: efflux RND transporter permease subunit [Chloroflexi bacterium]|nr:efflux RND transporter permease subunit [Chloroflexota bacterium]